MKTIELTKTAALNRLLAAGYNATITATGITVSGTADGTPWSAHYADAGQDANTYAGPVPAEVDALCVWDDASTRESAGADAPKGIRELRKIPFATLKAWIDRYRKANPGYYVAIRSRAEAHICLTDSWGQVLPHYMPYFRA